MKLRPLLIISSIAFLWGCNSNPAPRETVGDETSLRQVDERQRALIASRDADGMQSLADADLRINAPTNKVLTGGQLIGMMKSGAVAGEDFDRVPEVVTISGDVGLVMGRERFTATAGSESGKMFGARSINRRYTNVYRWKEGRWRFLARHANVIAPAAIQTPR